MRSSHTVRKPLLSPTANAMKGSRKHMLRKSPNWWLKYVIRVELVAATCPSSPLGPPGNNEGIKTEKSRGGGKECSIIFLFRPGFLWGGFK